MIHQLSFLRSSGVPERPRRTAWPTVVGVVCLLALVFAGLQVWWLFTAPPALRDGSRIVEIPLRLGLVEVAERLDAAGVIRSPMAFMALAVVRGTARTLKAGEYEIPRGANSVTVLGLLEGGKVLRHPVLLREGATLGELARAIEAEKLAPAADTLRVARDPFFLRTIDVRANSVEGYLFPDTYQFVKGMTPEEMLARMVARMREQVTAQILEEARARDVSLHQLLTLASIIEREAADPKEMPLISAVFWNRLKLDMPLQADPTVAYALGKEGRSLTRADLEMDSPFNTYRRTGLPPGPIGSPGRAAIEAAVRPANVEYLYFVALDGRRHQFSRSLAEHNQAVARSRLGRSR